MLRLAILVSGSGTTMKAILDAILESSLDLSVEWVISDRPEVPALNIAKSYIAKSSIAKTYSHKPIKVAVVDRKTCVGPEELSNRILSHLLSHDEAAPDASPVDLIVCAGFLSILRGNILEKYAGRIINLHPSLLPRHGGLYGIHVHRAVIAAKEDFTGCTVHYVDSGIDTGEILLQAKMPVLPEDTPETLQSKLRPIEHATMLQALKNILEAQKMKEQMTQKQITKPQTQKGSRKCLISVYDKTNIVEFAKSLIEMQYEILTTGGTFELLNKNNIPATEISKYTDSPEILGGRVKTLHPKIFGGILVKQEQVEECPHAPIDLVVVNLYPFLSNPQIETIDVGGPSMLRAAAKNFQDVVVVCDIADYEWVAKGLSQGTITLQQRQMLAAKVFNLTAYYDQMIEKFFDARLNEMHSSLNSNTSQESGPSWINKKYFNLGYMATPSSDLRYGENPHQKARVYFGASGFWSHAQLLQGKALSYNNYGDTDAALACLAEFSDATIVAVKHGTPCAVASARLESENIAGVFQRVYRADSESIFGGIVAINRPVTAELALAMSEIFLEVIVAPAFQPGALEVFKGKKNLRLLAHPILHPTSPSSSRPAGFAAELEITTVDGALLVQEKDLGVNEDCKRVTQLAPTPSQLRDLFFAQKVVKHVRSNGIVVASDLVTRGISGGQVNRFWAATEAIKRGRSHHTQSHTLTQSQPEDSQLVLASDGFFPFSDVVELANEYNIKAILQPGGSLKDEDSIRACDRLGIAMLFSGRRHFKH